MTKPESTIEQGDSFWPDGETFTIREEPETTVYDLEERTTRFAEGVIDFAKRISRTPLTDRIINQLVGAGTSVGANYVGSQGIAPYFRQNLAQWKRKGMTTPEAQTLRSSGFAIPSSFVLPHSSFVPFVIRHWSFV